MSSQAVEVPAVRFVIASKDVAVTRNGIASTIRAGSPVRADDDVVRASPGFFFHPTHYVFRFELQEISESGRPLRQHTETREIENLPPPGPNAGDYWRNSWQAWWESRGSTVRNASIEQTAETSFVFRGEIDRAPAEVVEVESTMSDGRVAHSVRKSYRQ